MSTRTVTTQAELDAAVQALLADRQPRSLTLIGGPLLFLIGVILFKRTIHGWLQLSHLVGIALLLGSLAILLAFSVIATTMTLSYDDRKGQPDTTASNEGYQLLDRHFRKDIVIAEFLVVESPTDMRTGKGLADLDEMASRIAQIPGVTKVSGVTRPAGARLEQAQLGWQNGQIGDKMVGRRGDGVIGMVAQWSSR